MPKNTSAKKRRRREAVQSAALHGAVQAVSAGFLIWGAVAPGIPRWLSVTLFLLAGICVLLILATAVALKNRFKEIEGGEEDAASEY